MCYSHLFFACLILYNRVDSAILVNDEHEIDDKSDDDIAIKLAKLEMECDNVAGNYDIDHYRLMNGTCRRSPADVRATLCPKVERNLKCGKTLTVRHSR